MTRTRPPEPVLWADSAPMQDTAALRPASAVEKESLNLATLLRVIRRRRRPFLLTVVVVTLLQASLTLYKLNFNPMYQGGFTLLISDPVNDRPGGNGSGGGSVDSAAGGAIESLARNSFSIDVPTLIKVLESSVVLEPVYLALQKQGVKAKALPQLGVSLVPVDPIQKGGIVAPGVLNVNAKGPEQQVVEQALKLTEKAYLNWATTQRQERLNEGLRFLDRQAPLLQAKSDQLQLELEKFRKTNSLVQPTEEALALRQQMETLQAQLLNQGGERRQLEQVRRDVINGKLTARGFSVGANSGAGSSSGASITAGANSLAANVPNQALLDELQRIEQEVAEARSRYQPGSPVLVSLLAARDKLRPQLQQKELEAVSAAIRQNAGAMATTRAQIERLGSQFQLQPALLREFDALKQKLEIADGNLANYLRTREQFQLEIAQRSTPWKVISPTSVELKPAEPSLGRGLLQGLLLGLVAGAGVALLRDRLDHVFHSPQEVRDDLQVPLLGHMPYVSFFDGVRREKRFLLQELDQQADGQGGYQRFFYQEALRNLYTSLRFLNTDTPLRSVAITSSVPSEGKSLLNVLLAKTLSELGQRVLLVDADLRKPQIHHRLGLDNVQGLSNLLTEEGLDWRDLVQPVPNYPGWSVITAGRLPPDPPRLLGSERMGELVRELADSGQFDLILYDTPPALGLADSALVAQHLEGIVLLVSLNRVDRGLPAEAVDRIRDAGAPLLGLITNARRPKGETKDAYGYGNGYRYDDPTSTAGSGGFDAGTAYSYYQGARADVDEEEESRLPLAKRLKDWRKGLGRWLDG